MELKKSGCQRRRLTNPGTRTSTDSSWFRSLGDAARATVAKMMVFALQELVGTRSQRYGVDGGTLYQHSAGAGQGT